MHHFQVLLKIQSETLSEKKYSLICTWLWQNEHSPLIQRYLCSQKTNKLEFTIPENFLSQTENFLSKLMKQSTFHTSKIFNLSILSICGKGFRQSPEIIQRATELLENKIVGVQLENSFMRIMVKDCNLETSIGTLHKALFQ